MSGTSSHDSGGDHRPCQHHNERDLRVTQLKKTKGFPVQVLALAMAGSMIAAVAAAPAVAQETPTTAAQSLTRSFEELGIAYPIRLRTVFGQASIGLNIPYDEVVQKALLSLRVSYSPSLIEATSHLSVLVNNEVVWTQPLKSAQAAGAEFEIPINPLLLVEQNEIRFELVAHYARDNECEDPTHSSLWLDVSNRSSLQLAVERLVLRPTLDRLPAPWFDGSLPQRLELPFVLPANPRMDVIEAAGIVANWFGAKAEYRGADFPVSQALPTDAHAVRFRVGGAVTEVLAQPNPSDPRYWILDFVSPDPKGLAELARGFVLSADVLSGDRASFEGLQLPEPQPLWARFSQLQDRPLQPFLVGPDSVVGVNPAPVTYQFDLPADFYPLERSGGEVKLAYRASRAANDKSMLTVLLNDRYLGSAPISPTADGGLDERSRALALEIPPQDLAARNLLVAQFSFLRDTSQPCEDFRPEILRGSIDPRSRLTVGRHAYFAEMPALEKLASGGYPYSRHGDLAQTALVLPEAPTADEVSAALILLGHLGRWTQTPALYLKVVGIGDLALVADRHLLVLADDQTLPAELAERGPLVKRPEGLVLRTASVLDVLHGRIQGRPIRDAESFAARVLLSAGDSLGSIQQVESPFSARHAVTLFQARGAFSQRDLALGLVDPGTAQFVEGGLVLLQGDQFSGYRLGDPFTVGQLPWWLVAQRWLSLHPYLVVPAALLFAILAAFMLHRLLRKQTARRLT